LIAHLKPLVIDLETLMNVKDAVQIHIRIRKKYPEFDAKTLQEIIDVILEYIAEGDKGQVSIQPERTNPKDALSVCDVPTSDYI
jgi:hypothetical protein